MALRPDILSHAGKFFAGNFISLFAGGGGIDLGLRILAPDARCVCYVEREIPAASILAARIADGALDDAPVWSDVSTFDGRPWRGLVDGIVGGFPCQDLSVAGKRAGIQRGNRSGLFYEYARIIREIRPRWVAIENVRAVLACPAGGTVLGELAALGFDAVWGSLEAADVGAAHKRHRKFILAYRRGGRDEGVAGVAKYDCHELGNSCSAGLAIHGGWEGDCSAFVSCVGDTAQRGSDALAKIFAPSPTWTGWESLLVRYPWLRPALSQAEAESPLCRAAHAVGTVLDGRIDALRACGNGVVPLQFAAAFAELAWRAAGGDCG